MVIFWNNNMYPSAWTLYPYGIKIYTRWSELIFLLLVSDWPIGDGVTAENTCQKKRRNNSMLIKNVTILLQTINLLYKTSAIQTSSLQSCDIIKLADKTREFIQNTTIQTMLDILLQHKHASNYRKIWICYLKKVNKILALRRKCNMLMQLSLNTQELYTHCNFAFIISHETFLSIILWKFLAVWDKK